MSMDVTPEAPRALTALDGIAPYHFRVWFAGEWGFESNARLQGVLAHMPSDARGVNLDCRRITLIDGATLTTMTDFAARCSVRDVGVTFECDDDPVGRLIALCGLDHLTIERRPLHQRAAGFRRR